MTVSYAEGSPNCIVSQWVASVMVCLGNVPHKLLCVASLAPSFWKVVEASGVKAQQEEQVTIIRSYSLS